MTNNTKNSSSFFVLASLGIYFGLVLTGGAQPVVGQETRQGAKVEMEQKRDVEKRPDGEKALEQFATALEEFYRVSHEISPVDHFRAPDASFSMNYFVTVKPNGAARFYSPPPFNEDHSIWSEKFRDSLMRLYDAFLPRSDDWDENLFVQFNVDSKGVSLKATIAADSLSDQSALSAYENALMLKRSTAGDFIRSQIFNASRVIREKNKIIVVANLPRAGLDSLLTKDGK